MTGAQGGAVCTSSNVKKIFQWAQKQKKKIQMNTAKAAVNCSVYKNGLKDREIRIEDISEALAEAFFKASPHRSKLDA